MKTITATVDLFGRVELRFGFDRELIDLVKSVSGFSYSSGPPKLWWGSVHALAALCFAGQTRGVQVGISWPRQAPPVVIDGGRPLRPFQAEAVARMLTMPSWLLAWAPRTGKTACGVVAGASAMATRQITRTIVCAPANVLLGWREEVRKVFPGLPVAELWGRKNVLSAAPRVKKEKELRDLRRQAIDLSGAAFVLCQHDLMAHRAPDLLWLAEQGLFAVGMDEPQQFSDYRAPRSVALMDLAQHRNAYRRWGFSGTPMRNRAADLPVLFEFLGAPPPTSARAKHKRSPWPYLIRYSGAAEVTHDPQTGASHWQAADVETEPEELKTKLWSVAHRLTREEVAPWLPAAERTVILSTLTAEGQRSYKALEGNLGRKAIAAIDGRERLDSLKTLTGFVLGPKLVAVVERLRFHADERGVKVCCGLMFHESLERLWGLLFPVGVAGGQIVAPKPTLQSPVFLAAGWASPAQRQTQIDAWKAAPGGAVLCCNMLANSVGLDLADAEVQVNGELAWVPSDALQWEARLHDVHQGKRRAPPLFEYVLAKGTIDEDMALAMLTKMGAISRIIGSEREQQGLDSALRESGLVSTVDLGLSDRSDVGVQAALDGLRRRLMGVGAPSVSDPTAIPSEALAGAVAEAFEDEPEETVETNE